MSRVVERHRDTRCDKHRPVQRDGNHVRDGSLGIFDGVEGCDAFFLAFLCQPLVQVARITLLDHGGVP